MPTKAGKRRLPHVAQRVHIVPMGFEEDRVVLPAIELRAERLILLANDSLRDKAGKFREVVIRRLDEASIAHEIRRAPIFSLEETLDLFVTLMRENRTESLFVNVAAGSKIQALAGCLAAMIVRTEGIPVSVYYVEPKRYKDHPPKTPLSFGLEQIVEIPPLTLPTPPSVVKQAMQLLIDRPFSKLELALALVKRGELDASKVDGKGSPLNERARVSLQSAVDQKAVQPLLSMGFATAQKRGKHVIVAITESGRQAASLLTAGMPRPDRPNR